MTVARKTTAHARRARGSLAWIAVVMLLLSGLTATPQPAAALEASVTDQASTLLGVAASGSSPGRVPMADLSQFQPGNIISDAVFFDSGTMSEAQIQAFLESKVPRCQAGYTCLRDWYDTSRAIPADAMCGSYAGGARERASTIIYKVARACGINPQVLLVMLQKEQGLVTHTWPSEWRYTSAMGQGCPDTAACDTRYYGFFNQMHGAAWQMKRYANPAGTSQYFTWYAPGKTWNVRWHPNAACGSAPVFIQNQATANLYYYTPYQPNAAAIRAGYGEGDGCSSYGNRNFYQYFEDWFGSTATQSGLPFGNVELVESLPGEFRVVGWAIDPNSSEPIAIHVYAGSAGTAFNAAIERPDVAAAYPGSGNRHGFDVRVPANGGGSTDICIYAMNVGAGANVLLTCRAITAKSGSPVGQFDTVKVTDAGVEVSGWAIDPDTTGATSVHVYVGSVGVAVNADRNRAGLGAEYAAYGSNHGFSAKIAAAPGSHSVCAYAINVGPGGTSALGCQTVQVPGGADLGRAPFGNYEALSVSGNTATASGWAIDPDTASPIKVHLYVGATGTEYVADKSRPDVGALYPASGANHGFSEKVTLPVGTTQVCAYAINNGAGGHTLLGCKVATVAATTPDLGRAPFGNLEAVTPAAGGATVSGWAIDPDTAASIKVHIYVDSAGAEYVAERSRPDVAVSYPAAGDRHGFSEFVSMTRGSHSVCVYAINTGAGGHSLLGCRNVSIP